MFSRKKDKIGIIEKLGRKLPDPFIIFILLYILVLVVTGYYGGNTFSMTSADGTSVSYEIKNIVHCRKYKVDILKCDT